MILSSSIPGISPLETDIIQAESKVPALSVKGESVSSLPKALSPLPVLSGGEIYRTTAAALGLPQDVLSITLLTFARLFSLAPGADLMANLRKEVLGSGSSSPKTEKEKAVLEAKALAAIAALDKGVILSRDSLEAYAAVADSGEFSRKHKNQKDKQDFSEQKEEPETRDLQELFENFEQNGNDEHSLNFLNRIPGKNGQRWIVWPFNYSSGGTELKVLVRLLIKEPRINPLGSGGFIIADITGPKRNWHFFLNKSAEAKLEADISVFPALASKDLKALRKEMEDFFKNLAAETEVRIHNGEESPSLAEELGNEIFPSINKEA